jgi:hypothetical protein
MTEYDSNMIKPVNGLQNISGVTPTRRREERKRRQQLGDEIDEKNKNLLDELEEEQFSDDRQEDWDDNECDSDRSGIDYRA